MGQPVVHFEIGGRDGEQLRGFYTELFDWKIARHAPAGMGHIGVFIDPAGNNIGLHKF